MYIHSVHNKKKKKDWIESSHSNSEFFNVHPIFSNKERKFIKLYKEGKFNNLECY